MKDNLTDKHHADALRATPVPEALRESLMEQMRNPSSMEVLTKQKTWPWRSVLSAAAALAISALILWEFVIQPPQNFDRMADYREAVAYYIDQVPFQLDMTSSDRGEIQSWLAGEELPTMPDIPVSLGARVSFGCKEISWGEVDISLVCFYESGTSGRLIHLFVAPRSAVSESFVASLGDVETEYNRETRGWVSDEWVCMLVPSDPAMEIAYLLDDAEFQSAS